MSEEKDRMPEAQKEEIFKGIVLMFASLPFVFAGPSLMFAFGVPQLRDGNPTMLIVSMLVMIVAVFTAVKGLKRILKAFFDKK